MSFGDRLLDIVSSTGCFLTFLGLLGVGAGFLIYIVATDTSAGDFMRECQQDHKHYECVAMWRQGCKQIVIPVER